MKSSDNPVHVDRFEYPRKRLEQKMAAAKFKMV